MHAVEIATLRLRFLKYEYVCLPPVPRSRQHIAILGSTGSIGSQTLDLVRLYPDRFRVVALAAGANVDALCAQALEFRPEVVAVADLRGVPPLRAALASKGIQVRGGSSGVIEVAEWDGVGVVIGAITGIAGLRPVLAALAKGRKVAVANKEVLVAAGSHAVDTAARGGGCIVPVDSEHSAIFQCLAGEPEQAVSKILLTASGGPFLRVPPESMKHISPERALRHPNWSMGSKVTIDSATMMNKGLEVIEAFWLFGIPYERIGVVVHPQSIVHSIVEFHDGSAKAQLGLPDMRQPILYALTYPERWPAPVGNIDWGSMLELEFGPPDLDKFPCLRLAMDAGQYGGSAPCVLNAANEQAVSLFLERRLEFVNIARAVEDVLTALATPDMPDLDRVFALDLDARRRVLEQAYVQGN